MIGIDVADEIEPLKAILIGATPFDVRLILVLRE
jgi:hypothetical protein